MKAGARPAERPDDVQSAPPDSSSPASPSPFGEGSLAQAALTTGASEPDLLEAERQSHVNVARSQSTTSALRRVEYANKNFKLMARLGEQAGYGGEGSMKRTRSVRLGLLCTVFTCIQSFQRVLAVTNMHT